MIVVVEIQNADGARAYKEYKAPSLSTAMLAAEIELRNYPKFMIVDAWIRSDAKHNSYIWEEW